jgi:LPXTG-motif cell wall-anchored protein
VLYAVWTDNGEITINYAAGEGGRVSISSESVAAFTGNAAGATATADGGYGFGGWTLTDADGAPQSSLSTFVPEKIGGLNVAATYFANFTPNTDTPYTVEYYYENLISGDYELDASLTDTSRTGTTGQTASITLAPEGDTTPKGTHTTGWGYNANHADAVPSGSIAGDGSLVLKVYFKVVHSFYIIEHFGTYTLGEGGTRSARISYEDHTKFLRLLYDGIEVPAKNYTVTHGSTVITLKHDYLETYDAGTYDLFTAEFADGTSDYIWLKIVEPDEGLTDTPDPGTNGNIASSDTPGTGDDSNMALWIILGAVALAALALVTWRRRSQ